MLGKYIEGNIQKFHQNFVILNADAPFKDQPEEAK
jgi:hypothetical protein